MRPVIELRRSSRKHKKWVAEVPPGKYGRTRLGSPVKVHFGDSRYSDYTRHKDPARMRNYVRRHQAQESWALSAINTAGFWSRWVLWNLPSLRGSVRDTARRFGVRVRLHD